MVPLLSFFLVRSLSFTSLVAILLFSFKERLGWCWRAGAIGPGAALGWELPCRGRMESESQVCWGGSQLSFLRKASWSHGKACLDPRSHWNWMKHNWEVRAVCEGVQDRWLLFCHCLIVAFLNDEVIIGAPTVRNLVCLIDWFIYLLILNCSKLIV